MSRHAPKQAPQINETRSEAKREIYRRSYERFCGEQLKIKSDDPTLGLIPLVLDSAQRRLYAVMRKQELDIGYIRCVTLKGRQSGWSTVGEALLFQKASLSPDISTLLIAQDEPTTARIFDMVHLFWQRMDEDIRPMFRHSSKRDLFFENPDKKLATVNPGLNSRMDFAHAGNINAGTGSTRHALHLSELAKYSAPNIELLVASLLPTIHPRPGTIVLMESTAYIGGQFFRDKCEEARSGKSGSWAWCFSPWWLSDRNQIPLQKGEKIQPNADERALIKLAARGQKVDEVPPFEMRPEQIKWYRYQLSIHGDLFEQEWPRDFESAWINLDMNVFDRRILNEMRGTIIDAERFVEIFPGPILKTQRLAGRPFSDVDYVAIWKDPEPNVVYDMGVDVAAGVDGGDWTVFEVFRRDNGEQVAEYHKHIDPVDAASDAYWFGKYYNNAQIIVEMNNVGYITGNRLALLAYPYIYIWRHRETTVPKLSSYAGFKTTYETKQLLVGNIRHKFLHKEMIVHSRVLYDEMSQFVRGDSDSYFAALGHDDAVMGLCLAIQGGIDESFGAPKAAPPENRQPIAAMPHMSDPRAGRVDRRDRVAEMIARDFKTSA